MGRLETAWSPQYKPKGASVYRRWYGWCNYNVDETPKTYKVTVTSAGIILNAAAGSSGWSGDLYINNVYKASGSAYTEYISGSPQVSKVMVGSYSVTIDKKATPQSVPIKWVVSKSGTMATTLVAQTTLTVPALLPTTIQFNANDNSLRPISGTLPEPITDIYQNVEHQIPNVSLSRKGYIFYGWNTQADGSGITINDGGKITPTTDSVTLYAQWISTYSAPAISKLRAYRTLPGMSEYNPSVSSTGTQGYADFLLTGGSDYSITSMTVVFKNGNSVVRSVSASTHANKYFAYSRANDISSMMQYSVNVIVIVTGTDGVARTLSANTYISKANVTIDIAANGNCIAFGSIATDNLPRMRVSLYGDLVIDCNTDSGTQDRLGQAIRSLGWENEVKV